MTISNKPRHAVVLVVLMAALFPTDTSAYLDPGTGSLFIQGVIATLAAAGYALRLYWGRIKLWFKGSRAADSDAPGPPVDPA